MKAIFSFLIIILLASCGSTKKVITNVISPRDSAVIITTDKKKTGESFTDSVKKIIVGNLIDFKTFSAKIKVDSRDDNGKNPDIVAIVRIIKDSVIWVSLTATFLNLEVYRAYITPDSVILMDKQKKTVQYRSLDYLQEVAQIPFTFKILQDLLIGNPVFFDTSNVTFKRSSNNSITASTSDAYFKHLLTFASENYQLLHSKLDDVNTSRHRTMAISYGNYENIASKKFSMYRDVVISEIKKMEVELTFKQIDFNKDLSVNFFVPKNFKRK